MAMNRFGLVLLRAVLLALGLMLAGGGATAGFKEGVEAYQRGDYDTAIAEWQPLAEAGNLQAQTALGALYLAGVTSPKDYEQRLLLDKDSRP